MQIIFGIILIGLVIAFIQMYWQFLLVVVVVGIIVGCFAYKNSDGATEKEKSEKLANYITGYLLCVFIFFVGSCMADVNLKSTPSSQKIETAQVETEKVEKIPEPIKHQNLSEDEQNFYEQKFNEYVNSGIDKESADERALANLNGLKKCIEKVNNLRGEEKNLYDTKFQEYLNTGIDKNSAIEKAYDDVREVRLKEQYAKQQIEREAQRQEEEQKLRAERERNYSENNYNEVFESNYVCNANSGKFHYTSCRFAERISQGNRIYVSSRQEAINRGFVPCKVCDP